MIQWLRLHTPDAGGPGSVPGQRARTCMLQLRHNMVKEINLFLKTIKNFLKIAMPGTADCNQTSLSVILNRNSFLQGPIRRASLTAMAPGSAVLSSS